MPPPMITTRACAGRLTAMFRSLPPELRCRRGGGGAVHARTAVGGVGAQHLAGALRVARGDRPDDGLVLGVRDGEAATVLQPAQPEQEQLLGQAAIGLRQTRVAREVDQRLVKSEV